MPQKKIEVVTDVKVVERVDGIHLVVKKSTYVLDVLEDLAAEEKIVHTFPHIKIVDF